VNQIAPSISTRISHRFSPKRGWLHSTSVQITMGPVYVAEHGSQEFYPQFPPTEYGPLLAFWTEKADITGRTEAERRNQRDHWKAQEVK
jgi:hypothetical protein